MKSSHRQVVFITGASSGIGAALAREYAQKGAQVVLAARRIERLQEISKACKAEGGQTLVVSCDVTQTESLEKAYAESLRHFGRIDTLVANAGFGVASKVEKLKIEDYERQFNTNVWGVIRSIQTFLPEIKKNQGRMVILGSVNSYLSLPKNSPYAMSKFAIRALADSLYYEMRPYGVSVTLICPGFIKSEIRLVNNKGEFRPHAKDPIPLWLQMPAEGAAKQIYRAIQKRKKEKIITFHGKVFIFLQRHFPNFLSWLFIVFRAKGRSEP